MTLGKSCLTLLYFQITLHNNNKNKNNNNNNNNNNDNDNDTNNWRPSYKKAYIGFWPIFIFCRIELIFLRLTCFDMKRIVPQLSWSICASFSRNNVCKNLSFPLENLSFPLETFCSAKNQKKPFVSLTFIIRIITPISYCCFFRAHDQGAERSGCGFVLLWHPFDTRSVVFFWSVSLVIS